MLEISEKFVELTRNDPCNKTADKLNKRNDMSALVGSNWGLLQYSFQPIPVRVLPRAGSRAVRIYPLHFLARCHER